MSYFEDRTEEIKKLHEIYNQNIPEIIKKIIDVPEYKRLEHTSENFGINLTKFNIFSYQYSLLDHIVGVSLLLDKVTKNEGYVISSLARGLAIPSFEESVDFIDKKYKNAEYTTYDAIVGSDSLFEYFLNAKMTIKEVNELSKDTIVKSVANFEKVIHFAYLSGLISENEAEEICNDILLTDKNEIAFKTQKLAEKFCKLSIERDKKYQSYEAKISVKLVANLLEMMMARGEIRYIDLYSYSDKGIYEIGVNSSDKKLSDGWNKLRNLNKVYTKFNPLEDKYCVKLTIEKNYIDPLVYSKGDYVSLSKLSYKMGKEIEEYINMVTDLYMYIDE